MVRVVLMVLLLAALIYAFIWLVQRRNTGPDAPGRLPRGPVGPDDDEDFLRELDWRRRRDERHPPEGT